jgi:hypothetical protein
VDNQHQTAVAVNADLLQRQVWQPRYVWLRSETMHQQSPFAEFEIVNQGVPVLGWDAVLYLALYGWRAIRLGRDVHLYHTSCPRDFWGTA